MRTIGRKGGRRKHAGQTITGPTGKNKRAEVTALPTLKRDGTIDPSSLSRDIKQVLQQAGIKKRDLRNPETSKFVMDFLEQRLAQQRLQQRTEQASIQSISIEHTVNKVPTVNNGRLAPSRRPAPAPPPAARTRQGTVAWYDSLEKPRDASQSVSLCWACGATNAAVYSICAQCGEAPLGEVEISDDSDDAGGQEYAYVNENALKEDPNYIWDEETQSYYTYVEEEAAIQEPSVPAPAPILQQQQHRAPPAIPNRPKSPRPRPQNTTNANFDTNFNSLRSVQRSRDGPPPRPKKNLTLPAGAIAPPAPQSKAPVAPSRSPRVSPRPNGRSSYRVQPGQRSPRFNQVRNSPALARHSARAAPSRRDSPAAPPRGNAPKSPRLSPRPPVGGAPPAPSQRAPVAPMRRQNSGGPRGSSRAVAASQQRPPPQQSSPKPPPPQQRPQPAAAPVAAQQQRGATPPPPASNQLPPPPAAHLLPPPAVDMLPPPVLPHQVMQKQSAHNVGARPVLPPANNTSSHMVVAAAVAVAPPPAPVAPPPAPVGAPPPPAPMVRRKIAIKSTKAEPAMDIMSQIKAKRRSALRKVEDQPRERGLTMEDKGGLANALSAALASRRLAAEEGGGDGSDDESSDDWSDDF